MAMVREAGRPPFETMTPAEARVAYAAGRAAVQPPPAPVASVRDLEAPGLAGPVPLRLFRGVEGDAPLPCLLFLHGGGWVVGDLDSHDGVCRRLAGLAGCAVLAVHYRLAPEHPFPAAVEDAAAALRFLAAEAATLGVDGDRLAVGGDSAGGNLAAVLALMGRDGAVPATALQLLVYPVTDLAREAPSYGRATEGVPLIATTMRWFIGQYAPAGAWESHAGRRAGAAAPGGATPVDTTAPAAAASGTAAGPGGAIRGGAAVTGEAPAGAASTPDRHMDWRTDWRASPLRAASLAGTPPALVVTAGHDPLADEGRAYAARLEAEGVRVTALHLADHAHGLLTMGRVMGATEPVLHLCAAALRDAWRDAGPAPDGGAA